jgi:hypothetical protein
MHTLVIYIYVHAHVEHQSTYVRSIKLIVRVGRAEKGENPEER